MTRSDDLFVKIKSCFKSLCMIAWYKNPKNPFMGKRGTYSPTKCKHATHWGLGVNDCEENSMMIAKQVWCYNCVYI